MQYMYLITYRKPVNIRMLYASSVEGFPYLYNPAQIWRMKFPIPVFVCDALSDRMRYAVAAVIVLFSLKLRGGGIACI